MTKENNAGAEEEQRFVKMIQKTIRRTFLKMGAVIGAGVLAIVLCVIFVLATGYISLLLQSQSGYGKK